MTIYLYVEMIVSGSHRNTKGTRTVEKITTIYM